MMFGDPRLARCFSHGLDDRVEGFPPDPAFYQSPQIAVWRSVVRHINPPTDREREQMRHTRQGFRFISLLISCTALASCLSGEAALRADIERSTECAKYQVEIPRPYSPAPETQPYLEKRVKGKPYDGPPPYVPVISSNPAPKVSCITENRRA